MDTEEARKVARLARVDISEAEMESLVSDAKAILKWAEQLEGVCGEAPKRETGELRDDIPQEFGPGPITENFPRKTGTHLEVPRSL